MQGFWKVKVTKTWAMTWRCSCFWLQAKAFCFGETTCWHMKPSKAQWSLNPLRILSVCQEWKIHFCFFCYFFKKTSLDGNIPGPNPKSVIVIKKSFPTNYSFLHQLWLCQRTWVWMPAKADPPSALHGVLGNTLYPSFC